MKSGEQRSFLINVSYDLVIRGGRVLDGTGGPWIGADISISAGRFAKIGRVSEPGVVEIDATGTYVSPGWIEMMDQSGEALKTNGLAEVKILQGIATAIAGEGEFPVPSAEIRRYFFELEQGGIALNWGTYYSPAQARREVMGDAEGRPTDSEMASMKALVDDAIQAGALGLATALIYPPDCFQTSDELIELARLAGDMAVSMPAM